MTTDFLTMSKRLFKEVLETYAKVAAEIRSNAEIKQSKDMEARQELIKAVEAYKSN